MLSVGSYWDVCLPTIPNAEWQAHAKKTLAEAQERRTLADYDTGSIAEEEAYSLRALAEHIQARVVIDVGTFIGTSALSMAAASSVKTVYTCDASNDCLKSTHVVHVYPRQTSYTMLLDLSRRNVQADLCFFDGVLRPEDIELIGRLTWARTVYACHDYNYGPKIRNGKSGRYLESVPRKGIGNMRLLQPTLPKHVLVEPIAGTTLALLVPESML